MNDASMIRQTAAALASLPPTARDAALGRAMDAYMAIVRDRQPRLPMDDVELLAASFGAAVIELLSEKGTTAS